MEKPAKPDHVPVVFSVKFKEADRLCVSGFLNTGEKRWFKVCTPYNTAHKPLRARLPPVPPLIASVSDTCRTFP
jgi:hypothetical protein